MNNIYHRPYLEQGKTTYFPYSREKLLEKPIFPAYVFDGGAFFFLNDIFGTANSDELLEKLFDGDLFKYWEQDGKFNWRAVWNKWTDWQYSNEWESHCWLHRLYILLPLAQRYCKTKDKKYVDVWLKILKDWDANNPYRPVNDPDDHIWFDMQVAWRTINLVHSIFLFGDADAMSEQDWRYVYDLLRLHTRHLHKEGKEHRELQKVGQKLGNHTLQIGMALIMVGTLLPELEDASEMQKTGSAIVEAILERAISVEGVSRENAVSYAHFIARLFVEADLLLQYNGFGGLSNRERICKQYEYLYQFSSPAGKSMQIGDSYALDAVADVEFVGSFYPLHFPRQKKTMVMHDGGLSVLRNDRFDLYIDAAQPKANGYAFHQHYGKPHFVLYCDGKPMVVDRGCPNYDRSDLYCELYVASAHNVITCDEMPLDIDLYSSDVKETVTLSPLTVEDGAQKISVRNHTTDPSGREFTTVREFALYDDRLEIIDTVTASEKLHFVSRMNIPSCVAGYTDFPAKFKPLSPDRKTLMLRRDQKMQFITVDTPYTFECKPCIDENNRINYVEVLTRRFYTDNFKEKTTIRLDALK